MQYRGAEVQCSLGIYHTLPNIVNDVIKTSSHVVPIAARNVTANADHMVRRMRGAANSGSRA